MGPVRDTRHEPMLHGIEMDVVDVAFEIGLIADRVFPIATLPNAFLALQSLALRARPRFDSAGKATFDEAPSAGEIRIVRRERPQCMEVIRQDANRYSFKWTTLLNNAIGLSQPIDFSGQQIAGAVGQHNGEKEDTAFDTRAKIIRHGAVYHARRWWARFALPTLRRT